MTWLPKLRISTAFDAGKPLSPGLQREVAGSEDLRAFAESAAMLDRVLKSAPPGQTTPPTALHASIMRAVHAADSADASRSGVHFWRWLPAPALAIGLLVGGWLLLQEPPTPKPSPVAPAALALKTGTDIAHSGPSTLLSPLSDELQRLKQDLDNTAQFILASLP